MFTRKDNRHWLKIAHTIIIGALFFAQLQLKFIQYACNDYGKTNCTTAIKENSAKPNIKSKDASHSTSYTKLNKRYPVSNWFAVASAPLIIPLCHPCSSPNLLYHQPFFTNFYKRTFALRGPPSSC